MSEGGMGARGEGGETEGPRNLARAYLAATDFCDGLLYWDLQYILV